MLILSKIVSLKSQQLNLKYVKSQNSDNYRISMMMNMSDINHIYKINSNINSKTYSLKYKPAFTDKEKHSIYLNLNSSILNQNSNNIPQF